MRFTKALFLVSCAVSGFATTVNDVKNQITSLGSQLDVITTLLQAFPNVGGNLFQALTIQTVTMALLVGVETATTVVQGVPLPISEQDGRGVLDQLNALEPRINAVSQALISKKTAFSLLSPIGFPVAGGALGLVRKDLSDLKTSLNVVEEAIEDAAPASLLTEGNALRGRINAVLDNTIAAYA